MTVSVMIMVMFVAESHWANPQYVLKLQDTDDDDDTVCSVIVQLMQKDRRKLKQKGEMFKYIGFIIYKVCGTFSLYICLITVYIYQVASMSVCSTIFTKHTLCTVHSG